MRNKFRLGGKVMKKAQYGNVVIPQLNESFTRVNKGRRMKVIARSVLSPLWVWRLPGWRSVGRLAVRWRGLLLEVFFWSHPSLPSAAEHGFFGHGCHQSRSSCSSQKEGQWPFFLTPTPLGFCGFVLFWFLFGCIFMCLEKDRKYKGGWK